jgi:hypothetical protein
MSICTSLQIQGLARWFLLHKRRGQSLHRPFANSRRIWSASKARAAERWTARLRNLAVILVFPLTKRDVCVSALGSQLQVFVIDIDRWPTLAFEAPDLAEAQEICRAADLRTELMAFTSNGAPVCTPDSALVPPDSITGNCDVPACSRTGSGMRPADNDILDQDRRHRGRNRAGLRSSDATSENGHGPDALSKISRAK